MRYYTSVRERYETARARLAQVQDWVRTKGVPFVERRTADARKSTSSRPTGRLVPSPPTLLDLSTFPDFPACDPTALPEDELPSLYASLLAKKSELEAASNLAYEWKVLVGERYNVAMSSMGKTKTQRSGKGSSLAGSLMVRRDRVGEGRPSSPRKVAVAKGMLSPRKHNRPSSPRKSTSPSKRQSPRKESVAAVVSHVETDQNSQSESLPATPKKDRRSGDFFGAVLSMARPVERVELEERKVEPTPTAQAAESCSSEPTTEEELVTEDEDEAMEVDIVVPPLRFSTSHQSPRKSLAGRAGSRSRSRSPEKSQGGRRASIGGGGSLRLPPSSLPTRMEDIFSPALPPSHQISAESQARLLAEAQATQDDSCPQPSPATKLATQRPPSFPPVHQPSSPPNSLSIPFPLPSQRPRNTPNAQAGPSRPRSDAHFSALTTRHPLEEPSVERSENKRKRSPVVVKEEEEEAELPPSAEGASSILRELRYYPLLGTPPLPKPDWENVRRREERMKQRREAGTKKKRRKSGEEEEEMSAKERRRERRREAEEAEDEREEERTRKEKKKRRREEDEEESGEEERSRKKKKKGKGKAKVPKEEELDEEQLDAAIAKGPSKDDPEGLAYIRKIHAKRRIEVGRKMAEMAAQCVLALPAFDDWTILTLLSMQERFQSP